MMLPSSAAAQTGATDVPDRSQIRRGSLPPHHSFALAMDSQRVDHRYKRFLGRELRAVIGDAFALRAEPPNDAVSIDQELSDRLVPGAFPVVSVGVRRLEAVEPPQC